MCSSYYYMGDLFRKQGEIQKAKAFFSKIIQIWQKFIIENDFSRQSNQNEIDEIHYLEAEQHLREMLIFFEMEFGQHHTVTAECHFAYGLVSLKIGKDEQGYSSIQFAQTIFANNLGEFDDKTKEVKDVLDEVEQRFNMNKQDQ